MYLRHTLLYGCIIIVTIVVLIQYYTRNKSATLISLNNENTSDLRPFLGIWCGKACWADYVSDEFYHIWKDLEDIHGWKEVADLNSQNRDWLVNDNLTSYFNRYFNKIPDLILYVEAFETTKIHSALTDWRLIRHPWLFIDDVHAFTSAALKLQKSALMTVKNIITTYPYKIDEEYCMKNHTELAEWFTFHRTWLPHSASISFFVMYNRNPVMKIFLSGAINNIYPYRKMALKMYDEMPFGSPNNTIEYHKHPGYDALTNVTRLSVRDAYARLINRYFVAMTDTSSKNYIVGKVFEIPVAGALLLVNSEAIPILARLNWFENVHYVAYNETNMKTVFSDVLSKKSFEKYEKIRWTGHRTALKFHSTKRRALFLHNLAINSYLHG